MKKLVLTTLILTSSFLSFSQKNYFEKPKFYNLMVGLFWNNVFDSGLGSKQFLDIEKSWNLPAYPSALNLEIPLKHAFRIDLLASYNYYKLGKTIDKDTLVSGHFFSFNTHLKFSLAALMEQQDLDFFILGGFGYTGRETNAPQSTIGGILGAGFNFFIINGIGVQLRGIGNFNLLSTDSNYIHVHLGLIYKYKAVERISNFSKKKYRWSTR